METPRPWLRAALPAVLATVLGLSGHRSAGADLVTADVVFACLPLIALSRTLCRRELGLTSCVAFLVLGQIWVHVIASLCGHASEGSITTMLITHALAALVAGLALRRNEASTWARARGAALRAWVRALLDAVPAPMAVLNRVGRARIAWTAPAKSSWAHPLLPDLRGPPAVTCH